MEQRRWRKSLYTALQGILRWSPREQAGILVHALKWAGLGALVGALSGSASALFLFSLGWATATREANPWLLFPLPLAGLAVGYIYQRWGAGAEKGNNFILETIDQEGGRVPLRMAPLVLLGTLSTHLFGGSAGREGTAVQMGGGLAGWAGRVLKLSPHDSRVLLMGGISGGFGSVFGTPLAGTIFGMEVLRVGAIRYRGLIVCLSAAYVGDWTVTAWGVEHGHYAIHAVPPFSALGFGKAALMALAFGLTALAFTTLTHGLKAAFRTLVPVPAWRPLFGGVMVIALTYLVGTRAYLGLSLPLLADSFAGSVPASVFLLKILFTAVTLGAGFHGGEVTPLFVIGASLGSTLSGPLSMPTDLAAGMGLVAVFAAAANTPLACIILGVELFGGASLPYLAVAAFVAYLVSGHNGIYASQRLETAKHPRLGHQEEATLQSIYEGRKPLLPLLPLRRED